MQSGDAADATEPDTLAGCTQPGPWGPPELVAGFKGINDPKLSADKRELYGTRFVTDFELVRATRPSATAAFSPDVRVYPQITAHEVDPALPADGLELFFASDRAVPGTTHIYVASRASTDEQFGSPTLVPGLEGESTYDLDVSADGLSLYATFSVGFGVASRARRDQPFTGPLPQAGVAHGYPAISFDGLELYTNSTTSVDRYTRPSKLDAWVQDQTFSIAGVIPRDPDLSHDGRELWFWSSTDTELYRVVRDCAM